MRDLDDDPAELREREEERVEDDPDAAYDEWRESGRSDQEFKDEYVPRSKT